MYAMTFDHQRNLIDVAWKGLFSPEQVADYARACRERFRAEGFAPGYKLRMDMSESAIQTQDAVLAFREAFRGFPPASRIAIVTPSAIARMQVRREMKQPYLQVFDAPEPALDWLTEAD